MDSNLEKLRATTKDQPNIFLIQEFERILTNISCLVEYKMDLFICEIVCDNYVIKKYMYSKRKNFLLIYRSLLFLLERRFETFMKFNVILFKHIIQDFWTEKSSEEIVLCLISINIGKSMKESKPNKSIRMEASKIKAKQAVVLKTKKGYAKKSFNA